MTKIVKRIIIIVAVLMIATFIVSSIYLNSKLDQPDKKPLDYDARKRELMTKQGQLEALVVDLNKTLQDEIATQNNLSKQVEQLTGEKNNLTAQTTYTPPQTTVVTPSPRITRAS